MEAFPFFRLINSLLGGLTVGAHTADRPRCRRRCVRAKTTILRGSRIRIAVYTAR